NKVLTQKTKEDFAQQIRETFSEVMQTGTEHIAISLREYEKYNLTIGRANPNDDICLMNLDIREGRSLEKRRELALRYMSIVRDILNVENKNQYITFTQHSGEDFHLIEKYLASWQKGEDPLA
ncbi:MAG: tautomerase, partial [Arcobacteraceae bacterium]|nr:tautomerase [Arcobacteraceae bacterium]